MYTLQGSDVYFRLQDGHKTVAKQSGARSVLHGDEVEERKNEFIYELARAMALKVE